MGCVGSTERTALRTTGASGLRVERRANEENGVKAESREVNLGLGVGVDAEIARVGDDADYGNFAGSGT